MTVRIATRNIAVAIAFALSAVALLSTTFDRTAAHAQATEGDIIVFEECSVVTLTVLESDALFTSVFWRFGPDGDLGVTSQNVGSTVEIPGEIPAGTELVLGIVVNETGQTYKTGPGTRNPDGEVHATIGVIGPNVVGFEDKGTTDPNPDWDYNDAVIQLSTQPCAEPEAVTLTVNVDPASTGTGSVTGSGTYALGDTANAKAIPGPGSSFVTWSGHCSGGSPSVNVLMDADKVCNALFSAVATPTPSPTPTGTPEPTATPVPPIAGPEPSIGIANTRTSPSPASVGDTVVFRIDVSLTDVPLANEAEVLVTYDDAHLEYVGALTSECGLTSVGIVCDFGPATAGFSFDLDFTALAVTDATATNATLGADYDGAGAGAPVTAGPATAEVAIIDVAGIQLPPLGDGSSTLQGGGSSGWLTGIVGVVVIGVAAGATLGAARRRNGAQL